MTIEEIEQLCRKYEIYPKRSMGQNFLLCDEALDSAVLAGDIKSGDVILEAGPGFGFLTKKLSARAGKVIGIELDKKLYGIVKERLQNFKNVEIIMEDVLKLSEIQIQEKLGKKYKIVSNLPYNITGHFLKKFLSVKHKPDLMVLMLQEEVAERICALPGKMSILSVSAQYYSKPCIILKAPKEWFFPVPEVDSAIIRFDIKKDVIDEEKQKNFFQIVRIGFSARRKMLKNNLYNGFKGMGKSIDMKDIENILRKCDLNINARAQDLSVEEWIRLAEKIKN
ncbi:MAG: 16S rRNA (adenine(1518)-N(6)/adenine(1519)-N(6))-dimethyltransferase RsmA [bacterium]